jgi:hypothetical protein
MENIMESIVVAIPFDMEAFARQLEFYPWPYSAGTYTNGAGRFMGWQKGERLLGMPNSELLFSEYNEVQQRSALTGFPAPKTMDDGLEAAVSIGWQGH